MKFPPNSITTHRGFEPEQVYTIRAMMKRTHEVLVLLFLALFYKATGTKSCHKAAAPPQPVVVESFCFELEAGGRDQQCAWVAHRADAVLLYLETYMTGGQYERDVEFIVGEITSYVNGIVPAGDGNDAWILDVDDTCISNVYYYKGKRYGCDPYDPLAFRAWAMTGECPAISAMLGLFGKLVSSGFKVILLTGRDEETLGQVTIENLNDQGFFGYEQLILRTAAYKGQSAVEYKSAIRKQIVEQGYRIWGNIGDQWSDLHGDYVGNGTFKLPNPMYFVP